MRSCATASASDRSISRADPAAGRSITDVVSQIPVTIGEKATEDLLLSTGEKVPGRNMRGVVHVHRRAGPGTGWRSVPNAEGWRGWADVGGTAARALRDRSPSDIGRWGGPRTTPCWLG